MPHIEPTKRPAIDEVLAPLLAQDLKIADIEYILSQFVQEYVLHNGLRFNTLKDIDGLFSTAQSEFYRLVTGPYEDIKIGDNTNAYQKLVDRISDLKIAQAEQWRKSKEHGE